MSVSGFSKTFAKYTNAQVVAVNTSSSGNTTLIAGVATQNIRIIKIAISCASNVVVELLDGGTIKFGPATMNALALDLEDSPWILGAGNALVLNLGSSVAVGGFIMYVQD